MQLEIVSFDADATINDNNNFQSGFPRGKSDPFRLAKARVTTGKRVGDFPLWALKNLQGGTLVIHTTLLAPGAATLESQRDILAALFDVYYTEGLKRLIVRDVSDGNRQWYVDCDPIDFKPKEGSPKIYEITLLAPDPQWMEVTEQTSSWPVTGTGQTHNVTVRGNRPTPLELRITPTSSKGVDYAFEHLVDVRNPNQFELNQYPVDLTNGGWDVTGMTPAEMQADGDDLRVFVDGKEVDRWLADMDSANTKVWINLDFEPGAQVRLDGAFNIGDLTLEYRKGSLTGRFKRKDGCVRVQNEMVAYETWQRKRRRFIGCTRGIRGTAEANHATGQIAYKVEHHIKIVYGDSTLGAPDQDEEFKPIFDLSTSTNAEWRYASFGDSGRKRSGRWRHRAGGKLKRNQAVDHYTGNQGVMADPWTEMGLIIIKDKPTRPGDYWDHWYFRAQVDITNTRFEGEYKVNNANDVVRLLLRGKVPNRKWRRIWQLNFTTQTAFTAWGPQTTAPRSGTRHLRLRIKRVTEGDGTGNCYAEVNDCRITYSGSQIPVVSGPTTWTRIANPYRVNPRITNNTTGEWIEIDFIQILNQVLTVRSDEHTIRYRGQNQYQALEDASKWEEWLYAQPGVNQLLITEPGVVGATIQVRWRGRNS